MDKGKRFADMRAESQKKILTAAIQLFAEKGYQATSVSDIARKAGMAKGIIYHYFSTKEDLLWKILESSENQMFAYYNELVGELPAKQKLVNFLMAYGQTLVENAKVWKILTNLLFVDGKKDFVQDFSKTGNTLFHQNIRNVFLELRSINIDFEISHLRILLQGWQIATLQQAEGFDYERHVVDYLNRF